MTAKNFRIMINQIHTRVCTNQAFFFCLKDTPIFHVKNPNIEDLKTTINLLRDLAGWVDFETILFYQLFQDLIKLLEKTKLKDKEGIIRFTSELQELDSMFHNLQSSIIILTSELSDKGILRDPFRERIAHYLRKVEIARSYLKTVTGPDLED